MELGNVIYGNSRGEYPIERSEGFEHELMRLFAAYYPADDSWRPYGPEFENDTFEVFPYYWGDCTCGYDEKDMEWSEANTHHEGCYQTLLRAEMKAYDTRTGYSSPLSLFDAAHFNVETEPLEVGERVIGASLLITPKGDAEQRRKAYDERHKYERTLMRRLCKQLGISWDTGRGCAVHCTCDFDERWRAFNAENSHDLLCPIVRPNFLYKPTGFQIQWYKYPLRDAYMSEPLTLAEFCAMIDKCVASITRPRD
jgi:hypothetical protein